MGIKRFCEVTGLETHKAGELVALYRSKNPKVLALWKLLENNLRMSATRSDETYEIELPSGRRLSYRKPNNNEGHLSAEIVRGGKYVRMKWWGGSLTENITQGMARDCFMTAVERIRKADIPIIMRVHDEVVCCVKDNEVDVAKKTIEAIMQRPPEWASNLSLACETKITKKYEK